MTSTPSSSASPASIAPAPASMLATKSIATDNIAAMAMSVSMPATGIGPTKTWVIPPRPKPGRKPATDTPPTKRKAQNRAAQRAFRERRAARVGELEEQLKETEDERQKRENQMHDQITQQSVEITRLEDEIKRIQEEATTWHDRYSEMQRRYEEEKSEKDAALKELTYLRNGSRATGTTAVPLPPRHQTQQKFHSIAMPENTIVEGQSTELLSCGGCTATSSCACVETAMSIATSGCGRCTVGGQCECLDETLKAAELGTLLQADLKRSPSTGLNDNAKRPRLSIDHSLLQEIDFTTQFSQGRPQLTSRPISQDQIKHAATQLPAESCGFCADGTYCACAEAVGTFTRTAELDNENRLAPMLNEVTPPPSDTDAAEPDVVGFKLPPLHPNHDVHHPLQAIEIFAPVLPKIRDLGANSAALLQDSCSGRPGSCIQCQQDPKSGLFCRSLAAMRDSNTSMTEPPTGCCGNLSTAGGGCCRQQEEQSALRISCADTYQTLKAHKNFDKASDNIGDWLPKLHTTASRYPGRAPLDIEAASVMNVIKYFDVRFGRDQ